MTHPVLRPAQTGIRCDSGGFHIDPLHDVEHALITHAHSDHVRPGAARYWCAEDGVDVLRQRVHPDATIVGIPYGTPHRLGSALVSFHPAGHILGSAQIRVEAHGEVWVVTGDYKRAPDPTCRLFEPVEADVLITEGTFGRPVYRWPSGADVARDILQWWRDAQSAQRPAVLFAYALGKTQRLLAELWRLDPDPGPVILHGANAKFHEAYADAGVPMLAWKTVQDSPVEDVRRSLVIAPPSAQNSPWMKRFPNATTAYASGWMRIRGNRRRRAVDRGFVLSDHADWAGLMQTVAESRAKRVLLHHCPGESLEVALRLAGLEVDRLQAGRE